jgi:hypothetical protein
LFFQIGILFCIGARVCRMENGKRSCPQIASYAF